MWKTHLKCIRTGFYSIRYTPVLLPSLPPSLSLSVNFLINTFLSGLMKLPRPAYLNKFKNPKYTKYSSNAKQIGKIALISHDLCINLRLILFIQIRLATTTIWLTHRFNSLMDYKLCTTNIVNVFQFHLTPTCPGHSQIMNTTINVILMITNESNPSPRLWSNQYKTHF